MADVMWKGEQVKKSTLSTLEYDEDRAEKLADKRQVDALLGQDKNVQSVLKQKTDLERAFRERFDEAVPEDAKVTKQISDSYRALTQKSVSSMQKGKRVKEAKEKLALQKHLLSEQKQLLDERKKSRELVDRNITQEQIDKSKENFKTEREQEALREWLAAEGVLYGNHGVGYVSGLHELNEHTLYDILTSMKKITPAYFNDFDDGSFASEYAQKYRVLCRLSTADVILEKYEQVKGTKSLSRKDFSVTELRARIKFFQEMKKQYEDRMTMMSSPYYVLLRKADLKEYMGPDGAAKIEAIQDPNLKEYVKNFVKCQSSPLAMGKDEETKARYQAIYAKEAAAQSKVDETTVSSFVETLDTARVVNSDKKIYTETTWEEKPVEELDQKTQDFIGMYDDLTALFESQMPKDDFEYIKTVQPELYFSGLHDMDAIELWELEKDVLINQIYEKGEIEGQKIEQKYLDEIKPLFNDLIKERRKMSAANKAGKYLYTLATNEFGCDFQNEAFLKSETGKKLAPYINYKGCDEVLFLCKNKVRVKYWDTLKKIFFTLSDNGYSISKKYDERPFEKEDAEEALHEGISKVDNLIEEERQRKEREINEGKENPERWDYPVIEINGKPFRIFDRSQEKELKVLKKMSYQLDGDEGNELLRLMEEQEKLSKQMLYGNFMYTGGLKFLVYAGYTRNYFKRMKEITDRIKTLVGEPIEENKPANANEPVDGWEILDEKEFAQQERDAKIRNAAMKRIELFDAEKAAKGKTLDRFIPEDRGMKGWKERHADEARLEEVKQQNESVDLYSMRILEAYQKEEEKERENPPELPQISAVAEEAFTWELSLQMLDTRYFWHHAAEMRSMFKKAERLRDALYEEGEEADALKNELSGYTEAQKQDLALIVDAVCIMQEVFRSEMMDHGIDIRRQNYLRGNLRSKTAEVRELARATLNRLQEKDKEVANPPEWTGLAEEFKKATTDQDKARLMKELEKKRRATEIASLKTLLKENEVDRNNGNLRYIDAVVNDISSLRGFTSEETVKMYKAFTRVLGQNVTTEEKQEFVSEFEKVMGEILSWDMNIFKIDKENLFNTESHFKQCKMLELAFEVNNFFNKYKQLRQEDGLTFGMSEDLSNEFAAKRNVLHDIQGIRDGYLAAYSSKYLEKYPLADLEKMTDESYANMMAAGATLSDQEKKEYFAFTGGVAVFKVVNVRPDTDLNKLLQDERTKTHLAGSLKDKLAAYNKGKERAAFDEMEDEEIVKFVEKEAKQRLSGSIEDIIWGAGYLCSLSASVTSIQPYSERRDLAIDIQNKLLDSIDDIFGKNLSSEYVDKVASERQKLNDSLYQSYLEKRNDEVPAEFLKKTGKIDMEKAKSEYAILMLFKDERNLKLSGLSELIQYVGGTAMIDKGRQDTFAMIYEERGRQQGLGGAAANEQQKAERAGVMDQLTAKKPTFKYLDETAVNNVLAEADTLHKQMDENYAAGLFGMKGVM